MAKNILANKKILYLLFLPFIIGTLNFIELYHHTNHHHHQPIILQQHQLDLEHQLDLALIQNEFLDKPPTKIVILGQLNSESEHVYDILSSAFIDTDIPIILHEHIYRTSFLDTNEINDITTHHTNILWIIPIKSPCAWADDVIQTQKKLCDANELNGEQCAVHEFASNTDYYRIPWYDWYNTTTTTTTKGSPDNIIIKSHHHEESKYDDIFDMRQRKLLLLKQIMDAMPRHVKVLRLHEFNLNPNIFVNDLVVEYQFPLKRSMHVNNDTYTYNNEEPISDEVVQSGVSVDLLFKCMEHDKWIEAQQRIDWQLEGYFGHNHLDCHLCRTGADKSDDDDDDDDFDSSSSDDDFDDDDDGDQLLSSNVNLPNNAPLNIYVLGERNSGTTFVSNTLAEAFNPPNVMGSELEKFSSDIPVLLHKHMFRHDALNTKELDEIRERDDILWILVVRSPCDWAEGMFRKPYHLCPPKHPEKCGPESDPNDKIWLNQNSVAGVSLYEFFTDMEWKDWAESVPFLRDTGHEANRKSSGGKTGVEVSISKVSSNYTYPNVFSLRRHKLGIMEQIMEVAPRNVKLVRLKELERSPELFIQSLVKEFGLRVKDGYKPQPQSVVSHSTTCLTPDEWDVAQMNIDWNTESTFGFSPFDCRMCYGYERSTRLYTRIMQGRNTKKALKEQAQANSRQARLQQEQHAREQNSRS